MSLTSLLINAIRFAVLGFTLPGLLCGTGFKDSHASLVSSRQSMSDHAAQSVLPLGLAQKVNSQSRSD